MNCFWLIAAWGFLVCGFARWLHSRRDAVIAGSVIFAVMLLVITEALSAAKLFYFKPLMLAWIAGAGMAAIFFAVSRRITNTKPLGSRERKPRFVRQKPGLPPPAINDRMACPDTRRNSRITIPSDPLLRACLGCIATIACVIGMTAIISPPNNWDSMTYHMARVANWVQHRTVAHYQTQILRQLYLGPWSEFAVANVQIFVGSDRLAGSVQFISMLLSVLGVSRIAAKLGASPRGQAVAGLFAATIPIMMLEASNTQTDCVAAFWVVCAVDVGLSLNAESQRNEKLLEILLALAVGLAFLTKATTAFVLAPFIAWIFIARFHRQGFGMGVRLTGIFLTLSILLNAPHFYRNYLVFGRILVPTSEAGWYQNSIHSPGAMSSNIMRNLLMNTGFRGMGRYPVLASRMVEKISGLAASDPRITYPDTHFRLSYTRDEHDAGNPAHLLLGMVGIFAAVWRLRHNPSAAIYAGCVLCGFFLFCFQLKWQPWITRLQLPIFVIIAPLFGLLIDRAKASAVVSIIVGLLFAQSLIYLLYGQPRTLIGPRNIFNTSRTDQYFSKRPDLKEGYEKAGELAGKTHPMFVGLACKGDSWEYAIRACLPAGTGITHVGVENQSRTCPAFAPGIQPEIIIELDDAAIPTDYGHYRLAYQKAGISIFLDNAER